MNLRTLSMEVVHCGVCHGEQSRLFANGRDFEYQTSDDDFKMVECIDCGNVYLNPRPTSGELDTIYPQNYYAYNYDSAINPLAIKAKVFLDQRKVKSWLKYVDAKLPRSMDVGCGNGRILEMLHSLGIAKQNLTGVEMHQGQIDRLNQQGYNGFFGRIEDVGDKLKTDSFDLIVMLQVLEHVENPDSCVKHLAQLLDKKGVLIIETPNTNSFDVRLFKERYWGGYHFPRHWNLFTVQTLERLGAQHGLQVDAVNFLPAHSFWIFSLHHLIEEKWKQPAIAKFFNPLQNIPLLAVFTGFDIIRAKLGFQTSNVQIVFRKP
jgi:2-polyprenyl-3-methyl-5-hydroxy-6-metoxy-1,4-benzoquinol methylase